MKNRSKTLAVTLAGVFAAIGLTAATSTPAVAETAYGCPWPYVCFMDANDNILTMYKDTGYQITGSKTRSATYVYNARNDDCAYLTFSDGWVSKMQPGDIWGLGKPVTAINITYGC